MTSPAALAGRRVVVSAGPTFEDIDPVRFIGNRSSGKMGFAIAAAAARDGAQVLLVAGPVHLPTPDRVQRVDVRSAAQMHAAVLAALPADVYIGAAAVADYAPRVRAERKLKKTDGASTLVLELVRTADILALIAANAVGVAGSGFESDDNTLVVHAADGARTTLGPGPKVDVARALVALVAARLAPRPRGTTALDAPASR